MNQLIIRERPPRRDEDGVTKSAPRLLGAACLYQILEYSPHRSTFLVPGDLLLGGVLLGNGEEVGGAELLRDRAHPLEEVLEASARRDRRAAREVDQLTREPEADRAPEVLLDQPVRKLGERLALVDRACDARGE